MPADALHPARPERSPQSPASAHSPEQVLKKDPAAMNMPVALKVPVWRYRPAAVKEQTRRKMKSKYPWS
eukprot:11747827-Alexandrium_andersonii.AAC.1